MSDAPVTRAELREHLDYLHRELGYEKEKRSVQNAYRDYGCQTCDKLLVPTEVLTSWQEETVIDALREAEFTDSELSSVRAALRSSPPEAAERARAEAGERLAELREALREVTDPLVSGLMPRRNPDEPPLNDYGLLSTLAFHAGPNARTAVGRETVDAFQRLAAAVQKVRSLLEGPSA